MRAAKRLIAAKLLAEDEQKQANTQSTLNHSIFLPSLLRISCIVFGERVSEPHTQILLALYGTWRSAQYMCSKLFTSVVVVSLSSFLVMVS